jgi:hypothetical protein
MKKTFNSKKFNKIEKYYFPYKKKELPEPEKCEEESDWVLLNEEKETLEPIDIQYENMMNTIKNGKRETISLADFSHLYMTYKTLRGEHGASLLKESFYNKSSHQN